MIFWRDYVANVVLNCGVKTMNENKLARWKGAGMGEYYCSLCQEVVDNNRRLRCPNCNARMYTNEEYIKKCKEWELEDKI